MDFPDNVTRLCAQKRFSFGCHSRVPCFTECCRELELTLTPYDVLRLRQELQMSSSEFFDRFVVIEQDDNDIWPRLYLGMVDDGRASCPFISESGCSVYNNRPGACRAYPVGRGTMLDANGDVHEIHVLVREEHCKGFAESQKYTSAEWFAHQGLLEYNAINDEVLSLLQQDQVRRGVGLTPDERDIFLVALYKLDQFRKKVSTAAFHNKYRLSKEESRSVLADDVNLLRFGIRWLREVLFTEKA